MQANPPRLRIAAHNGASIFGGGEKWTALLLAALGARGHTVRLFCRDEAMRARFEAMGVPASVGRLGGQAMLHHVLPFARALRDFRPDALLVSTFKKVWLAGMAARLAGVPVVVSRIGLSTDLPSRGWTYRVAYRRWVDAVLVNADEMRLPFLAALPGYDPARVATLLDGVPTRPPSGRDVRGELGIPPGAPVLGTVTRLAPQKRIDRLLHALVRVTPADAHCIIAGEGPDRAALEALGDELGLRERVHFVGFRPDVEDVLAALDLFLVTSDREGMANAMLEALAAGVPVVSTPVSGARQALAPASPADPGAGRVVEACPEALAASVSELLGDGAQRRAMADEGRHRAATTFSFDAMVERWERVLAGGALPS